MADLALDQDHMMVGRQAVAQAGGGGDAADAAAEDEYGLILGHAGRHLGEK
jgi:hypothetical protein